MQKTLSEVRKTSYLPYCAFLSTGSGARVPTSSLCCCIVVIICCFILCNKGFKPYCLNIAQLTPHLTGRRHACAIYARAARPGGRRPAQAHAGNSGRGVVLRCRVFYYRGPLAGEGRSLLAHRPIAG